MRHLLLIAGLLVATAASAAPDWDIYVNSRYGYSISYPVHLLKPLPESANGDGRAFAAKSGKAEFMVYAGGRVEGVDGTSEDIVKSEEEKCANHRASYKDIKPRLAAMSCSTGNDIFYRKTLLQGGLNTTFRAAYPFQERSVWDPVVATMARSMKPGRFLH